MPLTFNEADKLLETLLPVSVSCVPHPTCEGVQLVCSRLRERPFPVRLALPENPPTEGEAFLLV